MKAFKFIVTFIVLLLSTPAFAAFPGQNGKIAFQKGDGGIWLMNPDGSEETPLVTPAPECGDPIIYNAPKWSADGRKIVFTLMGTYNFCGAHYGDYLLMVINVDGSDSIEIANLAVTQLPGAFSPNGNQIVFTVYGEVFIADAVEQGGSWNNRVPLVPWEITGYGAELPTWSPDGSKIVFDIIQNWSDGVNSASYTDLFMINPDGTNLVQITHNDPIPNMRVYERSFDWSPDGTKLVFTRSVHSLNFSTNSFSIFISDADGSNRVELLGPTSEGLGNPVWSPDGTKILFDRGNPNLLSLSVPWYGARVNVNDAALYVMNADGTNVTQITDNTEARFWPSWQPLPQALVPTGTNVAVTAPSATETVGATLTFSSVTQDGYVNVATSKQGPTPPSGYRKGLYYDVNNTAVFSGSVVACFSWKEGQFFFEDEIKVFQYQNGAWTNVTTSVNTGSNQACGQSQSLSLFALFEPSVTFQNGIIAFERAGGGISVINPDGSGETILTNEADHFPKWSADGTKILFVRGSGAYPSRIYYMNADGTNVTHVQVTIAPWIDNFSYGEYFTPMFSPDLSAIVFHSGGDIFAVNTNGGNKHRLVDVGDCRAEEPDWSPDGMKIAFDASCNTSDGSYGNLYVMNSDGSNRSQITNNAPTANMLLWNWGLDWSPDGTRLLFHREVHTLDYSSNQYSIITSNADGSDQVVLFGPTDQIFTSAVWSPDGKKILMDSGAPWYPADAVGALHTMNADGTNITQFTGNEALRFLPDWQPIPVQSPAFTDTGNDIPVQPVDSTTGETPATITFSSVSEAGETTLTSAISGPTPPSGFKVGEPAVYYDVSTTATFGGTVTLCFTWTEGQFDNENNVALFHYENGAWQNVTTSHDTNANKVCGQTSSLSPFALFETAYMFAGFFSPVDNPPTRNIAKAGSAIPVKFSLGGNFGLAVFVSGYPASQAVQCDTSAPISAIEETVTAGGSSLTYDASSNQYIYIWKTNKTWANSCRRLVLVFNDGTTKTGDFSFTK